MDPRLQALLDKQDITELIHAFARAADRHDHAAMRALYHDDATDDHGAFFKGLASEFIEQLPDIQAPMRILHHNVTTVNIRLDGDHGEGEVYALAFHQVDTPEGPIDLLIGGRYLDRYEKRGGVWKFAHRSVLADWAKVDAPSTVTLDHPLVEGSLLGAPGPEDPSFGMFRLFRWGS